MAAMRVAMTTRSRYTERRLLEATRHGVGQYVVLGAGLDSFAYRSPLARELRVFEVDHPSTQASKRQRLADAAISIPDQLSFVAVDFAVDSVAHRLRETGFDGSRPAFVSWLGVTQYLCPGSELVMDYIVPAELRDEAGQAFADFFIPRAAAVAEPWLTFLTPPDAHQLLTRRGMSVVDDVGRRDQIEPWLWTRSDSLRPHELGRVARAVVTSTRRDQSRHASS